jgi:hypothetical protein
LLNISSLITIKILDQKEGKTFAIAFEEQPHNFDNAIRLDNVIEGAEFEISEMIEIKSVLISKDISVNKKIKSWKKIYEEIIENMLSIAEIRKISEVGDKNLLHEILMASHDIAVKTRRGPGNFVVMGKNTFNIIKKYENTSMKYIVDNKFPDNMILVGRKTEEMMEGLHLYKFEDNYKINVMGDPKNLYICLQWE